MSNLTLYQLTGQLRELEATADEDMPLQALADTLEGLQGEIQIKAVNVAKYARNQEMLAEAIEDAAKAMKERAAKIRRRVDSLHHYIKINMEITGLTKIESAEFGLTVVKNPPAVIVDNEKQIPEEFMVLPPPAPPPVARPDKKAIADAIKAGKEVNGCHLEQTTRLKVRV